MRKYCDELNTMVIFLNYENDNINSIVLTCVVRTFGMLDVGES